MKSHLFGFYFVDYALGVISKKIIAKTHVKELFPYGTLFISLYNIDQTLYYLLVFYFLLDS